MMVSLLADENKVSEYFVVSELVPRILALYRQILGVDFFPVPRTAEAGGKLWHDEAELYAVRSSAGSGGESEHLGYMALDLYPREGKYGHAAVWGLIPGFTDEQGERSFPTVCMVANLSKPSANKPALMKHSDVVTVSIQVACLYCEHSRIITDSICNAVLPRVRSFESDRECQLTLSLTGWVMHSTVCAQRRSLRSSMVQLSRGTLLRRRVKRLRTGCSRQP